VVLRTAVGVDFVVHVIRFDEEDVLADAPGFDVSFVTGQGPAKP
jgi:hypothetical protein